MNMMLLHENDFIAPDRVSICGRRAVHIREILKKEQGSSIKVGKINDLMGNAVVVSWHDDAIELTVNLDCQPPPALGISLLLAMPRPIVFKRLLPAIVSMGIKELHLFNCQKVEKSYWSSSVFDELDSLVWLGLEQSRDTIWPQIKIHKRFKPFAEDEIPSIIAGKTALVAHPGSEIFCPVALKNPAAICVGPEGGFTDFEVDLLLHQGFQAVSIGTRILRTETAIPAILGRLVGSCS